MKKSKLKKLTTKTKVVVALAVLLVIAQIGFNIYVYRDNQQSRDSTILSMIFLAVDGLHKPAPVEAKTGDTYLPEAKLVIPAAKDQPNIEYSYVEFDGKKEMSITSSQLINRGKSKVWSAYGSSMGSAEETYKAVFNKVPYLQACARGVQLFDEQQADENLTQRFSVSSGSTTWYGYTEKTCADDLEPLVTQLKTMRAY
jgi:hypothetical protein